VGRDGAHPPGFSLDVAPDGGGATTVVVAGELDLATADSFTDAIRTGLDQGPVVIDLAGLTFMDSAGVRALNAVLRAAADRNGELRVRREMQANVVQVLELTGMMGLLPLQDRR
jgi:anti-sigma B factor antagonist